MSVVTRFAPPSLAAEQYDKVVRRLEEDGISPADGLDYEVCFGEPGNLKVSLVWDSQEQFQGFAGRFGRRVRGILDVPGSVRAPSPVVAAIWIEPRFVSWGAPPGAASASEEF